MQDQTVNTRISSFFTLCYFISPQYTDETRCFVNVSSAFSSLQCNGCNMAFNVVTELRQSPVQSTCNPNKIPYRNLS